MIKLKLSFSKINVALCSLEWKKTREIATGLGNYSNSSCEI